MRAQESFTIRLGSFVAVLEEHRRRGHEALWRYVINHQETGEEIYDGWAGDPVEAQETAKLHLSYLCDTVEGRPEALPSRRTT